MSLRHFIHQARQAGYLIEIHREVSAHLELARVAAALDGKPVLFHRVTPTPALPHPFRTGEGAFPVLVGAGSAREYYALGLGVPVEKLLFTLADALAHPRTLPVIESGPCQEVVEHDVDPSTLLRASLAICRS